jgi:Transcriptional regulators
MTNNTILLTIRTSMENASKAEKILGEYILKNCQEIPNLSVADLSKKVVSVKLLSLDFLKA